MLAFMCFTTVRTGIFVVTSVFTQFTFVFFCFVFFTVTEFTFWMVKVVVRTTNTTSWWA